MPKPQIPKKENIHALVPAELILDLERKSGVSREKYASVEIASHELCKCVNIFVEKYNKLKGRDGITPLTPRRISRALYSKGKEQTFSEQSAETLCRYATDGDEGWEEYFKQVKDDKGLYNFWVTDDADETSNVKSEDAEENCKAALDRYLQQQIAKFKTINLPFTHDVCQLDISEIPVPDLALINTNVDPAHYEYDLSILEELTLHDKILILSEGGMGKTTLSKWIFTKYAEDFISKKTIIYPIYIDAREYQNAEAAMMYYISRSKIEWPQIQIALNGYIPLLIYDGLDESAHPTLLVEEIKKSETAFEFFKILVTSRPMDRYVAELQREYPSYTIRQQQTSVLPEKLIKDKNDLVKFLAYETHLQIGEDIKSNFLYYTSFIAHYLIFGSKVKAITKAQILEAVFEDYYFKKWEYYKTKTRHNFPSHFDASYFVNTLSLIAVCDEYRRLFGHKQYGYFIESKIVRTAEGFTHECMRNIVDTCLDVREELQDEVISFLKKTGVISYENGFYKFTSKVVQEYFSARGVWRLCFTNKSLNNFTHNKQFISGLWHSFLKNRNSISHELVAGYIEYPNTYVLKLFRPYKISLLRNSGPPDGYLDRLIFSAKIIGFRKKEISLEVKQKIIKQLGFILSAMTYPTSYSITWQNYWKLIYRLFGTLKHHFIANALINTGDELAFNTLFTYYLQKYRDRGVELIMFWTYFNLFPNNVDLQNHCLDILKTENCLNPNEQIYLKQRRLKFLLMHMPHKMIEHLTELYKYPQNLLDVYVQESPFFFLLQSDFYALWIYIKNHNNQEDFIEFLDSIIDELVQQTNEAAHRLSMLLIRSSISAEAVDVIFKRYMERMMETKTNEQLIVYYNSLHAFRHISPSTLAQYEKYFTSLFTETIESRKDSMSTYFAYNYHDSGYVFPYLIEEYKRGILYPSTNSDIAFGLTFLYYYPSTLLSEGEIEHIFTFLHHDDPILHHFTLRLLSAWKLENEKYIAHILIFIISNKSNKKALSEAVSLLTDIDIAFFHLAIRFNKCEEETIQLIECIDKDYKIRVALYNDNLGNLRSSCERYVEILENCGTANCLDPLRTLDFYLLAKGINLTQIILKATRQIKLRVKLFEVYSIQHYQKLAKIDEKITEVEKLLLARK